MPIEIVVTHRGDPQVSKQLDQILTQLHTLLQKENQTMASVADIQTALANLQTSVANETTVDQSILTLVTGLSSTIADLKNQLAAAIAAGADPAALQLVVDGLAAAQGTIDTNAAAIAAAVTANTPAAPTV